MKNIKMESVPSLYAKAKMTGHITDTYVKSTVKKKKRGTIYHTDSEEEEISFS
jgi:hypothetical protein